MGRVIAGMVAGYILGSISFAYLFTLFLTGRDIREIGTRNPGAANVARNVGEKWGVLVWIADTIKGMIPMVFARNLGITNLIALTVIGLSAVFGHCYPIFMHFKGGRGAATTGGIVLFLMPILFPVVMALWFIAQKINPRSPRVLFLCTAFYFLCLFLAYGLRVNTAVFVQTAASTIILIASAFLINPELIKELKSGGHKK